MVWSGVEEYHLYASREKVKFLVLLFYHTLFPCFYNLQVHSWLFFTFAFAFYIQFRNYEGETYEEVWSEDCNEKFYNCTQVIDNSTTSARLKKPKKFEECVEFFKDCTQTEPEKDAFTPLKVLSKTLAMAAGELTFDELPLRNNPIGVFLFSKSFVYIWD